MGVSRHFTLINLSAICRQSRQSHLSYQTLINPSLTLLQMLHAICKQYITVIIVHHNNTCCMYTILLPYKHLCVYPSYNLQILSTRNNVEKSLLQISRSSRLCSPPPSLLLSPSLRFRSPQRHGNLQPERNKWGDQLHTESSREKYDHYSVFKR